FGTSPISDSKFTLREHLLEKGLVPRCRARGAVSRRLYHQPHTLYGFTHYNNPLDHMSLELPS
ncbi:hypothetical protein JB92DRAFT_3023731, partial [Gautieria morchelliformis]